MYLIAFNFEQVFNLNPNISAECVPLLSWFRSIFTSPEGIYKLARYSSASGEKKSETSMHCLAIFNEKLTLLFPSSFSRYSTNISILLKLFIFCFWIGEWC